MQPSSLPPKQLGMFVCMPPTPYLPFSCCIRLPSIGESPLGVSCINRVSVLESSVALFRMTEPADWLFVQRHFQHGPQLGPWLPSRSKVSFPH